VEVEPESEWYMRAIIDLDTRGSGIWSGQMNIKSDPLNGTCAFLNLQGVSLRNPERKSVQTSKANQIFCYAYTSVGNGKTKFPEHAVGVYKGTGQIQNLGQGGVFSVVTNAQNGTAQLYGKLGNGRAFTFSGIVGRLFAPFASDDGDFLSASASSNSDLGPLPSGMDEYTTPQADMLEAVFRKHSNALMPIWSLADLNTDMNFMAGVAVFDSEKLHGSLGMINRPLGSTGFKTEYTANTLVGYNVAQDVTQSSANWQEIRFLSSISFPSPDGFGSYEMRYFGTDQLSFQKKNPERRVGNVENFRVETAVSSIFKGFFRAPNPLTQSRTNYGLYGVAIGGPESAGVGFLLRGNVQQTFTELLGNKQNFSDTSTEAIRFEAP
jgi:hypothetical protein